MSSLQLLSLTERGRGFIFSQRKSIAIVSGILVAGGTAVYMQSQKRNRSIDLDMCDKQTSFVNDKKSENQGGADRSSFVKRRRRKGGMRSLQVLTAILISQMGRGGMQNLMALVTTVALHSTLGNRLAKVQGFLFRATFLRRFPSFLRLVFENLMLCFLQSILFSTTKYLTATLSLQFRKTLTDLIHEYYFENMVYYKLSHVDGRIVNAEQRIASDTPRFCLELSELVQDDLIAVIDALLYTWQLCSYASPKYVVWILAYVLGAGSVVRKLSPAFGKLMSQEQQLEGEYYQFHSRLRTHAESVAFYGGEKREEYYISQKFKTLVKHLRLVHFDHWWFGMIQDFLLKYLGATVGVILIMDPFFAGNLKPDSSTLGRAKMLSNLRYHGSVISSLFQSLGTLSGSSRRLNRLSGYADRIHELMVVSRELSRANDNSHAHERSRNNYFSEADYIEFSGVKVITPNGNVLVDDLSLRLESGCNLLITGPNGSGKSSLFRVLGGLWPLVSGHIVKPGLGSNLNKEIFYVPQRPYMAFGTLRDQLIYPRFSDEETEPLTLSEMAGLLKIVGLEYLLHRYPLNKEINWGDELSLGEQQRLGMARLFYHKPKFAILDECTSAVTTDMEECFCSKVRDMGTSCITISHRPALGAFHDMVLSLDGEGGWKIHNKRMSTPLETHDLFKSSKTDRRSDAIAVERTFVSIGKGSLPSKSKPHTYTMVAIASSPNKGDMSLLPFVPHLQKSPRTLLSRVAAMMKILVPTLLDKQGVQLFALSLLVVSRTWISDRIATLNGTSLKYVLEQDKTSFVRLIGISIIQSALSSIVAPSLRFLTAKRALEWRNRITQHLLKNYLKRNAFYKVFNLTHGNIDADQRISYGVEKLTADLSGLTTSMVKPTVDILWFTWRMKVLTGQRGVAILYAYMLLGLGFLRNVTPDFGDLMSREQELEGTFRFMHSRLRAHAESIAFFGGGFREKAMVDTRFKELLDHSSKLQKKKWIFGILNNFITKQLPHNVTWGLSFLYAMELEGDSSLVSTQGDLAHALRFLASIVSQSFLAFGDILELQRKFHVLSGGINRIFELDELLDAAQTEVPLADMSVSSQGKEIPTENMISFSKLDIISPGQKLLVKQLTCSIMQGKSLLVTGPNGSGKSSIFRILRGLWPIVSGELIQPCQNFSEATGPECKVFYIPQCPYTSLGTLRDQIIYPLSHEEAVLRMVKSSSAGKVLEGNDQLDAQLFSILENIRLVYLLDREKHGWDACSNWEDTLSLGEQQRLGMARLFFHCPKFGILDECTNATSIDVEERLYKLASEMGITVVTSSQRPALIPFHSNELRLIDGEGAWELREIKQ